MDVRRKGPRQRGGLRPIAVLGGWLILAGCATGPTEGSVADRAVRAPGPEFATPVAASAAPDRLPGQPTPAAAKGHPAPARRGECVNDGDIDANGVISSGDAQLAFFFALEMIEPTAAEACAADCNADGVLSAEDAQGIFYSALGSNRCAADRNGSLIVQGTSHVRATTSGGRRVRFGVGLMTPVGLSAPTGSGFAADFGAYAPAKDF